MNEALEQRWPDGAAPFNGQTVSFASQDLTPLPALRLTLLAGVPRLQQRWPEAALCTLDDWHEHDGFVNEAKPASWHDIPLGTTFLPRSPPMRLSLLSAAATLTCGEPSFHPPATSTCAFTSRMNTTTIIPNGAATLTLPVPQNLLSNWPNSPPRQANCPLSGAPRRISLIVATAGKWVHSIRVRM